MNGMKIEEVAVKLNVSVQTINRWYKFKKDNPTDTISKSLPTYKKIKGETGLGFVRIWNEKDLQKLIIFKDSIKVGRTGKMGKYKGKGTKNAKKEDKQ